MDGRGGEEMKKKNLVVLRTPLLLPLVQAPGGEVGEVNKLRAVGVVGEGSLGVEMGITYVRKRNVS